MCLCVSLGEGERERERERERGGERERERGSPQIFLAFIQPYLPPSFKRPTIFKLSTKVFKTKHRVKNRHPLMVFFSILIHTPDTVVDFEIAAIPQ